jgi:hypothetical protein
MTFRHQDHHDEERVIRVVHYFPDEINVNVTVTMESVPASLGLDPGTPTLNDEETQDG